MGEIAEPAEAADEDWTVEHRFRAVVEVLDGSPVAEVARRYGTSRQSLHTPKWGARRIAHELAVRGVADAPGRSTVHRVLVRNGLVNHQVQVHRRVYKRWQRDAPMQLWQLDLMGGVFLADGRECKLLTGIDDCSRFIVIAAVLVQPTGRAVCQAFIEAMRPMGSPRRC